MINNVVLVGRLTKDVEVRKTNTGTSVAQFTVACNRRFARNDGSSNQPTADFINCVAWRQSADFLGTYAKKGNLVGIEGRIQTRNYDDRDGKRVYVTEVVADNVQLLESRRNNDGASYTASSQSPSYANNASYSNNTGYTNHQAPSPAFSQKEDSMDDFNNGDSLLISDDDLPF